MKKLLAILLTLAWSAQPAAQGRGQTELLQKRRK